ncbi:MAG: M48 family metallopeptidase [Candidatus Omnitrophica bacterium]|nr:M48 family metallopeptidase [Candidatus Omnitrophota bacterium]
MIAKKYQAARIKVFFIELAAGVSYFLIFQFSGLSCFLKARISFFTENQFLTIAAYLLVFGGIYYCIALPLKFYGGFLLEHKYSLSNQRLLDWLKDEAKQAVISSAIFLVFVELFYLLLGRSPFYWWLWMAALWFLFSVFFMRIFPVLILPLFYRQKALDNAGLRRQLLQLAAKSGVDVSKIFEVNFSKNTKKANAALVGLGRSRRIILADNLVSNYTEGEIKVVVAHELGHHRYLHIWKLMVFGAVTTLADFYVIFLLAGLIVRLLGIQGIYDIEAFPILSLLLLVFGFMAMPLHNFYSRRLETQADVFALKETGDKKSFISCMEKLAANNLSDPSPGRFIEFLLYDHPPISKRIKFAERYIQ